MDRIIETIDGLESIIESASENAIESITESIAPSTLSLSPLSSGLFLIVFLLLSSFSYLSRPLRSLNALPPTELSHSAPFF